MGRIIRLSLLVVICIITASGCEPTPTPPPTPITLPALLPTAAPAEIRPADGMAAVYVPGGEFEMGSETEEVELALQTCRQYRSNCGQDWFIDEEPLHTVVLDNFWIDRTEVTNAQYQECVEAGGCDKPRCWDDDDFSGPDQPVVCVDWRRAQDYCAWAGGRLPTEAEWEYAARGPEGSRYPWGDEFDGNRLNYCDVNCEQDWADDSNDDGYMHTAPVGSYPAGASWCGALDMAGNVWEWVEDWHGYYPAGTQVNPLGPPTGGSRVARGGSWRHDRSRARGAERSWDNPDFVSTYHGFRCVSSASDSSGWE
jgi:formylglycine-generating enzyme required for sulfatase activity